MWHVLLINWSLFGDQGSGHPNFGHQVGRFRWVQDMPGRALHSCGPCQDGLSFFQVVRTWWFWKKILWKGKKGVVPRIIQKHLKNELVKNPQSSKIPSRYITWTQTFGRHEVTKTSFKLTGIWGYFFQSRAQMLYHEKWRVRTCKMFFFSDTWMNHHHQRVWTKFMTFFIAGNLFFYSAKK